MSQLGFKEQIVNNTNFGKVGPTPLIPPRIHHYEDVGSTLE